MSICKIIQKRILGEFRLIGVTIISVFFSLIIFGVFLIFVGRNPIQIYSAMWMGAFGGTYEFSETIVKVIPLILCALAVALPAKTGLLNLGGEGQLHIGAIGAAWVALYWTWLPSSMIILCMFICAAGLGAIWGGIPGFLKARLSVNEVLVTLLMNYVAIFFLDFLVHGPWRDPASYGWPFSPEFSDEAILTMFSGTRVHLGILYGVLGSVILAVIMKYTKWGFFWRIIGDNPNVARTVKIKTALYTILALALAGAFAGIAGFGEVSAIQGRLRPGISPGYGYTGFLIAWLARNNFIAILFFSLFVGGILAGGDQLQIKAELPYDTVDILQGIILLMVLIGEAISRKLSGSIFSFEGKTA